MGDCKICLYGIVLAKKKRTGDLYTFRCFCSFGSSVVEKIPLWSPTLTAFYELELRGIAKTETPKMPVPYKDDTADDEVPF